MGTRLPLPGARNGWRAATVLPLLAVLLGAATGARAAEKPDILLITVDTLRADHLGAYGYERQTSPAIDRLLAGGAVFTDARTIEPLTAPALASLLTSIHPHEHGSTRNGLKVRPNLVSFSKILERNGWETAAFVGNWTLQDRVSGLAEHFEAYEEILTTHRWFGMVRREATAEDLNEAALEWLEGHVAEEPRKPFLLWVHYVEPHGPYKLHRKFVEQIGAELSDGTASKKERYDSEIAYVDWEIGNLVTAVGELVENRSVLTVFASDHGESLGEHSYWGHGRHLYEASLKIPLGITWPGRIEPQEVSSPSLLIDVGPTLLGLVDLEVPEFLQGQDWTPMLIGGAEAPGDRVTYYQSHKGAIQNEKEDGTKARAKGLIAVGRMEDGRKEILHPGSGKCQTFDVIPDPAEVSDLADAACGTSVEIQEWLALVREGLVRSDSEPPPSLDEEDLDALRALGYID